MNDNSNFLCFTCAFYYFTAPFKKVDKVKYKIDQRKYFSSQINTYLGKVIKRKLKYQLEFNSKIRFENVI